MTAVAATVRASTPPTVGVTISGLTVGWKVNAYRVVDGERTLLRGLVAVTAASDTLFVVDAEAPFGVNVSYVASVTDLAGTVTETVSNTVTLVAALPWVTDPLTNDGVALTIRDWDELSYESRTTLIEVAGRRAPIAISDACASASSALTFITLTKEDLATLTTLLGTGEAVLVRPASDSPAVEPAYLVPRTVKEKRRTKNSTPQDPRAARSDWVRFVELTVRHVDQPAPKIAGVTDTLADLAAFVPTTLLDLSNAFGPGATLLKIAQTPVAAS